MQPNADTSQPWLSVVYLAVAGFLAYGAGIFTAVLRRKQPEADLHLSEAQTKKTHAEARRLDVESSVDIGQVVVAMSKQVAETQHDMDEQRERHRIQIEFLQKQIDIKTGDEAKARQDEALARKRAHDALGELQRSVMVIRSYEEKLRHIGIQFQEFKFKSYEEIMGEGE